MSIFNKNQKVIYKNKLMIISNIVSFEEANFGGMGLSPHEFPKYLLTDGKGEVFINKNEIIPYNSFFKKVYNVKDIEIEMPDKIANSVYKVGEELVVTHRDSPFTCEKFFGDIAEIVDVKDNGRFLLDIYIKFKSDNKIHKLSEDETGYGFYRKSNFDNLSDHEKQEKKNDFK